MPLALEGGGPGPGLQQAHWALMGRGNPRRISPHPPIPEGPSPLASLLLLPPSSSYAPGTHVAGGDAGRQGTRPRSPTGFSGPRGRRKRPRHLL